MCGIAGLFINNSRPGSHHFDKVLDLLSHRGPNQKSQINFKENGGMVWLGHTRLSVIDVTNRGNQPMTSGDGRFVLVYNGEIYNYRELRVELIALGRQFVSASDTEVLLQAWEQWGAAVLPRLVGMFAFVIYDRLLGKMHGARDAFGIKPLYISEDRGSFRFASEIAALLSLHGPSLELNWQTAYDYLAHGFYDAGEKTFFNGVHALSPGFSFCYDTSNGELVKFSWWKPSIAPVRKLSIDDAAQELRRLLLDSVRLHLRSDVPLGAALSGGLDSSAIVGCMRYLEPDARLNTFSFIAPGSNISEEFWVDLVNKKAGAVAHKLEIAPRELASDLDDMIAAQGEPFGSTSIYAQYRVFRLAREHGMTVTLDGQGADELCGGYVGYPGPRIRSLLDEGHWGQAADFLHAWGQWGGRRPMDGLKAAVAEFTGDRAYQLLRRINGAQVLPSWLDGNLLREAGVTPRFPRPRPDVTAPGRRMCAELARSLHGVGLPGLLRHGDRNSMRFSIESRVPFLTTALADFLLTLPEEYLVAPNGETKHLLRRAMRGLVPDEVLNRRDKIGFATPERDWLMKMAPQVREWLREPLNLPFLRQDEMLKAFDQVVSGKRPFNWQVWRWINFTRWHARQFGG